MNIDSSTRCTALGKPHRCSTIIYPSQTSDQPYWKLPPFSFTNISRLSKVSKFYLENCPQQVSHNLAFFRTITFTFSDSLYHSYPSLLHTVNEKNISKFYLVLLHVSQVLLCIFRTELNTEAPLQASLPLASLSSPICRLLFVRANRPL